MKEKDCFKHPIGKLIDTKNIEEFVEIISKNIFRPTAHIYSHGEFAELKIRDSGIFKGLGYHLSNEFLWVIVEDDLGEIVLIQQERIV